MNFREKVEYLSTYQSIVAKIAGNLKEYERWLVIGSKCTQMIQQDEGHGSGGEKRIENAAIMMAEISKAIDAETQKAIRDRDEIERCISDKSKYRRYAELLEMRFIKGMSNYEIANSINKNVRTVRKVMRKAIDTLEI